MTLTVGSLFSGIGGLDLGLERAGMNVIWQSEIDPYATRVLEKHWPGVPNHGDITRINFADVVRPDVICGGYPCQPFSTAGKRQGEEDPRHLWPWVREAIRVLRPRYAILENVRGHLSLGGTTVLSEIAALGYSAEWRVVSAASVGANHRRDRIIIVAYPNNTRWQGRSRESEPQSHRRGTDEAEHGTTCANDSGVQGTANVADPNRLKWNGGGHNDSTATITDWDTIQSSTSGSGGTMADAEIFGPQSCKNLADRENTLTRHSAKESNSGSRPIYSWWETEPDVGRVADGIPSRVDRLKGLGNAVVPQVAEVIGRLVIAHNEQNPD